MHRERVAFADQRAHQTPGLDLVVEIDRRRRAFEFSRGVVLIERLAEVAFLLADHDEHGGVAVRTQPLQADAGDSCPNRE